MNLTLDQIRAGYARNAKGSLRKMLLKAEQTGRAVNGFSADYLRNRIALYATLSRASDAELRAHLSR